MFESVKDILKKRNNCRLLKHFHVLFLSSILLTNKIWRKFLFTNNVHKRKKKNWNFGFFLWNTVHYFFSSSSTTRHIYINQLRSTLKRDFVFFCSHVHRVTLNSIVFFSSSPTSYASIVSSKKRFTFFFFLHITKTRGKKGNENALSAYTSRSHFSCMYVLCKGINRQRKKNEKRTEKIKNDSSKARERIHGCLVMKNGERNTNELHTCIRKEKKTDGY